MAAPSQSSAIVPAAAPLGVRALTHLVSLGVCALFSVLVAAGSVLSLAWLRIQYRDWSRFNSGFDDVGGNPWDNAPLFFTLLAMSVAVAVVSVMGCSYVLWSREHPSSD